MLKQLFFTFLFLTIAGFCFAQKSSNKTLTVDYTIDPTIPEPEKPISYWSMIKTPLDPLSPDEGGMQPKAKLEQLAKTTLAISGAKYIASANGNDWLVTVETGDVKMMSMNEKPLNDLAWEDAVFGYSCAATLTVKDKSGKVILEKVLASETEEQKMPKAAMFINPGYRMKLNFSKNNPEKMKKLSDEMLTKKNYLVLLYILEKADKELTNAFEVQVKTAHVSVFSVKGKAYEELSNTSDKIFDTFAKFRAFSKKNRIPKEDMDKVMSEAIPVWEKYIAEHKELEEKASKGLALNCALATTWTGDYDKAMSYFSQVSEAVPNPLEADAEDAPSNASMGATILLSFKQSAVNLRNLYESFKEHKGYVKITQ